MILSQDISLDVRGMEEEGGWRGARDRLTELARGGHFWALSSESDGVQDSADEDGVTSSMLQSLDRQYRCLTLVSALGIW